MSLTGPMRLLAIASAVSMSRSWRGCFLGLLLVRPSMRHAVEAQIGTKNVRQGPKASLVASGPVNSEQVMPQNAAPNSEAEADRLQAATNQAVAACGGDVRAALKATMPAKSQSMASGDL
jgi:hypothetical protein